MAKFQPTAHASAHENLAAFTKYCRRHLTTFGAQRYFEADKWPIGEALERLNTPKARFISFTEKSARTLNGARSFEEPFLSFAKCYFLHQGPTWSSSRLLAEQRALRQVYGALRRTLNSADPCQLSAKVCDLAASERTERAARISYEVGRSLEHLVAFMRGAGLLSRPFRWVSPVKLRQYRLLEKVGAEFDARRIASLPSEEALHSIAKIFREAQLPKDVLGSAVLAILAAVPGRVSEALQLDANCLVTRKSSGSTEHFIRWRPFKGAEPLLKPVPTAFVPIVVEAIARVRRLSVRARRVARWYEKHATGVPGVRGVVTTLGSQYLRLRDVGRVTHGREATVQGIQNWLYRRKIRGTRRGRGKYAPALYLLTEIEQQIRKRLPRGFPVVNRQSGVRYSDALFCVPRGMLAADGLALWSEFYVPTANYIINWLSGTKKIESVFERFGCRDSSNRPIKLRTHQLRHWLNTISLGNGLSDIDVAIWSGRKSVAQNSAYDHQSDRQALEPLRRAMDVTERTHRGETRRNVLIRRDEFESLQVNVAHVTAFGYCVHDFAMLPCQMHRDCINCTEHFCIKGQPHHEESIRLLRDQTAKLLVEAKRGVNAAFDGANRWVAHNEKTLGHLNELCASLDDPDIPVGAALQPSSITEHKVIIQQSERKLVRHAKK